LAGYTLWLTFRTVVIRLDPTGQYLVLSVRMPLHRQEYYLRRDRLELQVSRVSSDPYGSGFGRSILAHADLPGQVELGHHTVQVDGTDLAALLQELVNDKPSAEPVADEAAPADYLPQPVAVVSYFNGKPSAEPVPNEAAPADYPPQPVGVVSYFLKIPRRRLQFSPNRLAVARQTWLISAILLCITVTFIGVGVVVLLLSGPAVPFPASLGVFALGAFSLLFAPWWLRHFWRCPIVFDARTGRITSRGRRGPDSVGGDPISFHEIAGVQVCRDRAVSAAMTPYGFVSAGAFDVCQVNLCIKDDSRSRIHIVAHRDSRAAWRDAERLAAMMNVPVFDSVRQVDECLEAPPTH